MTEIERAQRLAVCAEARSWIGTLYHEDASVKIKRDADGKITDPGGVDCIFSIVAFYGAVPGLLKDVVIPKHSHQFMLHKSDEIYLTNVLKHAREITCEETKFGDLALYRYGKVFSHGALISESGWPNIIHAAAPGRGGEGMCVEGFGDQGRLAPPRPVRFFTVW